MIVPNMYDPTLVLSVAVISIVTSYWICGSAFPDDHVQIVIPNQEILLPLQAMAVRFLLISQVMNMWWLNLSN